MKYPTELYQLAIRHMEVLETAPLIVDEVEKTLFQAINTQIKKRVMAKEDWEGCYDFMINKSYKETTFTPKSWPKDADGSFYVYYTLDEMDYSNVSLYLSSAIGLRNESLGLYFYVYTGTLKLTDEEYKIRLNNFLNTHTIVQKAGFTLTSTQDALVRRFHFDAEKLAEVYPCVKEAFAPLNEALDDLFKVHEEFNTFVQSLPWTHD